MTDVAVCVRCFHNYPTFATLHEYATFPSDTDTSTIMICVLHDCCSLRYVAIVPLTNTKHQHFLIELLDILLYCYGKATKRKGTIVIESLGEVIHKRKEAKEKQEDKGLLPDEQLSICTNGEGSTTDATSQTEQRTEVQQHKSTQKSSNKQLIASAQIDEYLLELVMDDVIDPQYTAWVAKCCYALGIQVVNRLVISARAGRDPKRLLAFKLKAAMKLHHKRTYLAIAEN